ncbi:Protein M3 [Allomyces arbusculus]|nr:Protein M3 [Allomyces arbusculus]
MSSSSVSLGVAIWAGARAMLKLFAVLGAGALTFRLGLFDRATIKTMGKMFVHVYLPALIFAKTAVAITPTNAPYILLLVIFASGYLALGHLVGYLLYRMLPNAWLPAHFRTSIVSIAAYGNHGDFVLSIIASVGAAAPFAPGDADRGIAYVSVWYAVFNVWFYAIGIQCIERDFRGFAVTAVDQRDSELLDGVVVKEPTPVTDEDDDDDDDEHESAEGIRMRSPALLSVPDHSPRARAASTSSSARLSAPPPPLSTPHRPAWSRTLLKFWTHPVVRSLLLPPNIALALGLVVALTPISKWMIPIASGPPLGWLYDASQFLGQAAIPLSMTLVGAALTTIDADRAALKRIENRGVLISAVALAVYRLVLVPVIGIAIVQAATNAGWVPKDDLMLRFVLMAEACVPTAQICIIMTQFYHPRGESKEAALVMLVQYLASFFTVTIALAYIYTILT